MPQTERTQSKSILLYVADVRHSKHEFFVGLLVAAILSVDAWQIALRTTSMCSGSKLVQEALLSMRNGIQLFQQCQQLLTCCTHDLRRIHALCYDQL
jgi:hypothetical protein